MLHSWQQHFRMSDHLYRQKPETINQAVLACYKLRTDIGNKNKGAASFLTAP